MQPGDVSRKQGAKQAKNTTGDYSWNSGVFEQHNFGGCMQILQFSVTAYENTKVVGWPPPPKNVRRLISEYVDRKKGTIFFNLTNR